MGQRCEWINKVRSAVRPYYTLAEPRLDLSLKQFVLKFRSSFHRHTVNDYSNYSRLFISRSRIATYAFCLLQINYVMHTL